MHEAEIKRLELFTAAALPAIIEKMGYSAPRYVAHAALEIAAETAIQLENLIQETNKMTQKDIAEIVKKVQEG